MKTPLRYQMTEFDCGTISLLNSIMYLFDRNEIPAGLVKAISIYTLDCYDEEGNLGHGGTSRETIKFLSGWITKYAEEHDFGIECEYLEKDNVEINKIRRHIAEGGVCFLRTYQKCEHYVAVTDLIDDEVYLFDPYYLNEKYYSCDTDVTTKLDNPFKYNRIVSIKRFDSIATKDFALGPIEKRECVLIKRKNN